jgi:ferredoxin--NADP+ reductase
MKSLTIVSKQKLSEDAYLLSLDFQPDFLPGQVVEITESKDLPPRLYSICSPPGNPTMDILFDIKEEGRLTNRMAKMKKGDFLFASEPSGKFTCTAREKAYWIAAGTGIAPFASMFFAGLSNHKILIHGGRRLNSFYFQKQFEKQLKDSYIRCCTKEKSDEVYHGRLTAWLKEREILPQDYKYYLCGSAEMVVQTRDILVAKGIDFDSIIAEIYF